MGLIRQMNHQLSDKIAAGEVVERPASVVKELLENAVDAKATKVDVHVEEAGLGMIRVIDNGVGMDEEDALLAFKRHATSKLQDEHDLFRIRTLGFRGEALPSIASVSHMVLSTSTGEGPGTEVHMTGGSIVEAKKSHSRQGTDVRVSSLFFNTPARLKYVRSLHTELGHITEAVNRVAVACPHIQFSLVHEGKELLKTSGNGRYDQVLGHLYGMDVAKALVPVEAETSNFVLSGFAAKPTITRASRHYFSLVLNQRYVKNIPLFQAVMQGYKTLLPIGRYPVGVLSIEMDPMLMDANVHPSKLEVRLSMEKELCALVTEALEKSLRKSPLTPEATRPKAHKTTSIQESIRLDTPPANYRKPSLPQSPTQQEASSHNAENSPSAPAVEREEEQRHASESFEHTELAESMSPYVSAEPYEMPELEVVGQHHGTYILAQSVEGLFIIDQHAAQERIKYEFYKQKLGEHTHELQDLALPLTMTFRQHDYLALLEHKDLLLNLGLAVEDFGEGSLLLRSHPVWFPHGKEEEAAQDVIQKVLDTPSVTLEEIREEAAILMSCKKSIKANMYLRKEDMQTLVNDLRKAKDPYTCPHGRPVIVKFSEYELKKMFKRVM
ncbi:DNA mismatch repair endonuclease MutL [Aureibacillus halotolerans]|uniref:DNA mismatch repair protein MutL n=1 Tax=Aureibacillus halotolerans TaxID=1508390 RepID=A0A4R6U9H4_9BACI|nr:DNA mismatch repair endonuclease MutL [Aureibacillus halotolerans]TDQ39724.1 DNA mismatch repair protein MutL [Aureibacillus halotolerans]